MPAEPLSRVRSVVLNRRQLMSVRMRHPALARSKRWMAGTGSASQVAVRFALSEEEEEEWDGRVWDEQVFEPKEYPHSDYKKLRVIWCAATSRRPLLSGCWTSLPPSALLQVRQVQRRRVRKRAADSLEHGLDPRQRANRHGSEPVGGFCFAVARHGA